MAILLQSAIAGYLFGGLPFGLWLGRIWGIGDIRSHGSGNIGATNVWRTAGRTPGLITLGLDILKGAVAVLFGRIIGHGADPEMAGLVGGLGAVVGHIFSPFVKFRGGKGVNTAAGAFLMLLPYPILAAAGAFTITVALFRFISLGSIVAAWTLFGVTLFTVTLPEREFGITYAFVTILVAFLITYTHRANITRILQGQENKFTFSGPQSPRRSRGSEQGKK